MGTGGAILAFLAAIIWIMVLGWIIAGLFIWIGSKLAGIEKATFLKCLLAALACTIAVWLVTAVCSVVPVIGTILGFIVGHLVCIWILMSMFETNFGRAFLAWIFHFVAQVLAVIIAVMTFAGGLLAIVGIAG